MRKIRTWAAFFFFACAAVSAFLYIQEELPYIQGRLETEELTKLCLKTGDEKTASLLVPEIEVDFEALKAEKKESKLGSIYMHHDAAADFTDAHTILFGHNMRSGQRFGELSEYADREFAEENPDVWIFLPGETLRCTVYSAYACPVEDLTYTIGYQTGEEAYRDLLCHTVKSSQIRMEDLPSGMDRIITLSTCTDSGDKGRRFVVNCFAAEKRELSGKEGMQNRKKIRKNICR